MTTDSWAKATLNSDLGHSVNGDRFRLRGCRPTGRLLPRRSADFFRFAHDLYGAFPVKWFFVRSGKAVLHPVACDPVPGARGRGQGTETLAELGGLPPSRRLLFL